jgi:cytochrome c oxidase subunit 3
MFEGRARAHHFDDLEQQRSAATLGMWIFLATEIMLFGGLFTAYAASRWVHPGAWVEGSRHLDVVIGGVNTAVLIVSSLTMAQAVQAAQRGRQRPLALLLGATALLGLVFLGLKAVEYLRHFQEGLWPGRFWGLDGDPSPTRLFFHFYYLMTGLHALHLTIGVALVAGLIVLARRGRFDQTYATPVETVGLYWHLVDVLWVFLFPLLYLVG